MNKLTVVYSGEEPPLTISKSIFLAGPTPRSENVPSWRPDALAHLRELGFDGVVFVPESRDEKRYGDYTAQVEWEDKYLNMADCILFWVPRELKTMPAFTTNVEWGVWQNSGKVVFGAPPKAEKVRYLEHYAKKLGVPSAGTLKEIVRLALKMVGNGAARAGGEREVPLHIWKTQHFQNWYQAQKKAGNRLDSAKVSYVLRVGKNKDISFIFVLWVNVYIANENRNKTNEIIIARPDIATIVMWRYNDEREAPDIVLIREFRSPAATGDGCVHEVPGGSSLTPKSPEELVIQECEEETGLKIDPKRLKRCGTRQFAATLCTHQAHLFALELTEDEMEFLKSQQGVAHGVIENTERTYIEIKNIFEIMEENSVDWSMMGMILTALLKEFSKDA